MPNPIITVFCVYQTGAHEWRWHLMTSRERIIALAAEHYRTEEECLAAVGVIKRAAHSPIEITSPSRPKRIE